MKKRNVFIGYFVFLMLIATFVACASTSKQESTGEYVDDSVITTKVKSLLAADDFLKSFQIGVENYKGFISGGEESGMRSGPHAITIIDKEMEGP